MNNNNNVLGTLFHRQLKTALFGALVFTGLVLLSQSAEAQATYTYTGNTYATVSAGPYTTSMSVTATLQLSNSLAPNMGCVDITTLPGFRLVLSDGLHTLDTSSPPPTGYTTTTRVTTDTGGHIVAPWSIEMYQPTTHVRIATNNLPSSGQCGIPATSVIDDAGDNLIPTYAKQNVAPGNWSP